MRRIALVALCLVTLFFLGIPTVMAEGPYPLVPTTSYPFIYNKSETTANVTIEFYDLDGNLVHAMGPITIPGKSTYFVNLYDIPELGDSFSGSMVVSADQEVMAICNLAGTDASGDSYSGIRGEEGETSVSIASVHCNNYGWWTEISVQAMDADATVTVTFTPAPAPIGKGTAYTTPPVTIKAGSSHRFSTLDLQAELGGEFVGGATVTSTTGKIAAAAVEWNTEGTSHMTLAFNGVTTGGTTLYFPAQHNNDWGWFSYNYIKNTTSDTAEIAYEWTDGPSGTATIEPYGVLPLFTGEIMGWTSDPYVGALKVTSTNGKELIGICNEVNTDGIHGLSYNAFYGGGTTVIFPSQHNNNYGWFSFNFLQNLDNTDATVQVTWTKTAGPGSVPAPFTTTIPANGKLELHTGTYLGWDQDVYGSLIVESLTGQRLVGICNEVNTDPAYAGADAAMSYNAFVVE